MVEKLWKAHAMWFGFLIAYFGGNLWCPCPNPTMVHLKSITTLLLLSPLQGVCGNLALLNVLSNYIELELFTGKIEVGTQCEKAPNFKAVLVR